MCLSPQGWDFDNETSSATVGPHYELINISIDHLFPEPEYNDDYYDDDDMTTSFPTSSPLSTSSVSEKKFTGISVAGAMLSAAAMEVRRLVSGLGSAKPLVPTGEEKKEVKAKGMSYRDRMQFDRDLDHFRATKKQHNSLSSFSSTSDSDMYVFTGYKQGESSVSRTFRTKPGLPFTTIRYRFVTREVPEYYGSEFNDYCRITATSAGGVQSTVFPIRRAMNSFSLNEFDLSTGSMEWKSAMLQVDPKGDVVHITGVVANVGDNAVQSYLVIDTIEAVATPLIESKLSWNTAKGGLNWKYTVRQADTDENILMKMYWAVGPGFNNKAYSTSFSHVIKSGLKVGYSATVHISGSHLLQHQTYPQRPTHILLGSDELDAVSIKDVSFSYGGERGLSAYSLSVLRNCQRYSGASYVYITRTWIKTNRKQALTLWNNMYASTRKAMDKRVEFQLGLYCQPNARAVIAVFKNAVKSMTTQAQVIGNKTVILDAMVKQIAVNPRQVTKHLGQPTVEDVFDVGATSSFSSRAMGDRFIEAARVHMKLNNKGCGKRNRIIDERGTNKCLHFEIDR
jgi:hypothetical protein